MLLSLASSSLPLLVPNPPPPSAPPIAKFPFTSIRKSMRQLIDDNPEALEEVENDISFVYSGWAPLSVRLVQCIAQKGGVLSNPAEKEKPADEQTKSSIGKVQAHPIVGWKGFEDVVSTIPGATVETVLRKADSNATANSLASAACMLPFLLWFRVVLTSSKSAYRRAIKHHCGLLLGRLYVHRDCCPAMGRSSEQRSGCILGDFDELHVLNNLVRRPQVLDCHDRNHQRGKPHRKHSNSRASGRTQSPSGLIGLISSSLPLSSTSACPIYLLAPLGFRLATTGIRVAIHQTRSNDDH
jgi:hypothetical protein